MRDNIFEFSIVEMWKFEGVIGVRICDDVGEGVVIGVIFFVVEENYVFCIFFRFVII